MTDWPDQIPKIELHCHLEGAIPLSLFRKLGGPEIEPFFRYYHNFAGFLRLWAAPRGEERWRLGGVNVGIFRLTFVGAISSWFKRGSHDQRKLSIRRLLGRCGDRRPQGCGQSPH